MIPVAIERMDDRMDAIHTALVAALPLRVVKRSFFRHYTEHEEAELDAGVVMIISSGEGDYKRGRGMIAREGTHSFLLIGHLKVDDDSEPQTTEAAELDLIEELKAFARLPMPGMSLYLAQVQHSRQLEHPYGWVVAYLEASAPSQNTH